MTAGSRRLRHSAQVYQNARLPAGDLRPRSALGLHTAPSPEVARREGGTMVSKLNRSRCGARLTALTRRWRRDESWLHRRRVRASSPCRSCCCCSASCRCASTSSPTSPWRTPTWQAARAIRTGQLQQAQGAYTGVITNADRKKAFKAGLVRQGPTFLDCTTKAVVIVQSNTSFGGIVEPNCASNGVMINQSAAAFNPGRRQLRGARHRLLPLGVRRQAAVLQDRATCRTAPS